jgi:hypothetical protein
MDSGVSECLACGLKVDDRHLEKETGDGFRLGLYPDCPGCGVLEPTCATHYIDESGACLWCGVDFSEWDGTERPTAEMPMKCEGHETCMYCMDW